MNNKFKVGDWVVRDKDAMGGAWRKMFPTTYDKPKRIQNTGPLGIVDVEGYNSLDCYFKPAPALKPFREEDYL